MTKFLLIFILTLTTTTLLAQTRTLTGIVNANTSRPIENATVNVYHISDNKPYMKITTDSIGRFKVVVSQSDYLLVTHLGYLSYRINPSSETSFRITLIADSFSLGEVTVKSAKPLLELQFDRTVVNVDGDPKAGINAIDVLRKVPGVNIINDNEIRFEGKSITVNIDDKPTRLSGSDLINLLNSTTTKNISKIEVLYNPSAKYDAQGEGGILNIKTIKRARPGYDASMSLTGGHGWKYLTNNNASASINYRRKNDYLYASYGLSKGKQYQEIQTSTRIAGIGQSLLDSAIYNTPYTSQNTRLGYDHYFNKKSVFGILLTGYLNDSDPNKETSTRIFSRSTILSDSTRKSSNFNNRLSKGFNMNLNYKLTLDSAKQQEISMDADGSFFDYRDNNTLNLSLRDNEGNGVGHPYSLYQNGHTLTRILSYKADYTQKVGKTTIESGFKVSNVKIENSFLSNRTNDTGNNFDNGSNDFEYRETILAGYISSKFELAKFTIQAGLRAEQTFTESYSLTLDSAINRTYLNLFPNLTLGYKLKSHSFSASYSRRIGRPNYSYLNPFSIVRSAYSINRGNPYLLPSFTNNFRLGYSYKGNWTFSLTYRQAKDVITDLSTIDDQSKVTIDTKANLSDNQNYGANFGYYSKLFKVWDLGLSMGLSKSKFQFNYQNAPISISQSSFTYSVDNRFTLKKTWWISAFLYGQTKATYGNQINLPYSYLNLGIGKNIIKGKGSLSLALNDIYYGSITRGERNYGNVDNSYKSKYDSRNARLNFTYNFGNSQVKIRRRTAGSSEEQGRSN